jgi:hypothetical protein
VYGGCPDFGAPSVTLNGIASSLHVITWTVRFRFHGLEKAVKLEEIGFEPFVAREGMQLFRKRK